MGTPQAVAVALIAEQGCFLLVHCRAADDAPLWALPAGKLRRPGKASRARRAGAGARLE